LLLLATSPLLAAATSSTTLAAASLTSVQAFMTKAQTQNNTISHNYERLKG